MDFLFQGSFKFTANLSREYRFPTGSPTMPHQLPHRRLPVLGLMNLQQHTIITVIKFVVRIRVHDGGHSEGLGRYRMAGIIIIVS